MSSFTEQVLLRPAKTTNRRILENEVTYYVWTEDSNDRIQVPAWYEFDWASVPRRLWTLVGHPMDTKVIRSALIHDYIYTDQRYRGRKQADDIFYEAMVVSGVDKYRALIYYRGVRIWGGFVWRRREKKK